MITQIHCVCVCVCVYRALVIRLCSRETFWFTAIRRRIFEPRAPFSEKVHFRSYYICLLMEKSETFILVGNRRKCNRKVVRAKGESKGNKSNTPRSRPRFPLFKFTAIPLPPYRAIALDMIR